MGTSRVDVSVAAVPRDGAANAAVAQVIAEVSQIASASPGLESALRVSSSPDLICCGWHISDPRFFSGLQSPQIYCRGDPWGQGPRKDVMHCRSDHWR